ncbi:hypothetical protein ACH436_14935 [Isoptericola sp. NPDC019693]|uniref:hypothetical protein n=1 Tax=Isoptericola sp. NPDC019693 TaxID=3364009 RepID=UPI0037AE139F
MDTFVSAARPSSGKARISILAVVLALLVAVAGGLAAPRAQALPQLGSVVCGGTTSATYDPGITYTPQNVSYEATRDYQGCVVIGGGGITSLQDEHIVSSGTRSCLDLLSTQSITKTYVWDTGATSTFEGTYTYVQAASVLTIVWDGTFTAGAFDGHHVRQVLEYPGVDALTACSSPQGLQELDNGIVAFTVLPL